MSLLLTTYAGAQIITADPRAQHGYIYTLGTCFHTGSTKQKVTLLTEHQPRIWFDVSQSHIRRHFV